MNTTCPMCGRGIVIDDTQLEDLDDISDFICDSCDDNWRDRIIHLEQEAGINLEEPRRRRKPKAEGKLERKLEKEWRQDFEPRAPLPPQPPPGQPPAAAGPPGGGEPNAV